MLRRSSLILFPSKISILLLLLHVTKLLCIFIITCSAHLVSMKTTAESCLPMRILLALVLTQGDLQMFAITCDAVSIYCRIHLFNSQRWEDGVKYLCFIWAEVLMLLAWLGDSSCAAERARSGVWKPVLGLWGGNLLKLCNWSPSPTVSASINVI